jgi:hypothetical protein
VLINVILIGIIQSELNSLAYSTADREKLMTTGTIMHTKIQLRITLYNLEAGVLVDV